MNLTNDTEIIDLGSVNNDNNSQTITLNNSSNNESEDISKKQSVNFGEGIELLMNEKRKGDGSSTPKNEFSTSSVPVMFIPCHGENWYNNVCCNLTKLVASTIWSS